MPCYHPVRGHYASKVNKETGKRPVVFTREDKHFGKINLPCGRCEGCFLERSRQWAIRCVHEASLHEDNCFITLTFGDKCSLPGRTKTLVKSYFQDFMKRLRRYVAPLRGVSCWFDSDTRRFKMVRKWKPFGVRFFHCGEYGEIYGRPHHHALLFGFNFRDRVLLRKRDGANLYRSALLESLWTHGYSSVGDVTFQSASYVARYVMKKVVDTRHDIQAAHYCGRVPEYGTMSRRTGIASKWFSQFSTDIFPKDFVVINGVKCKVPKFYNRIYELSNPDDYGRVKSVRVTAAREDPDYEDNEPVVSDWRKCPVPRLTVKEMVKLAQINLLKRPLDV